MLKFVRGVPYMDTMRPAEAGQVRRLNRASADAPRERHKTVTGPYRHRGDPENFHFEVWVEQGKQFSGGCVMVEIHARNLRDLVRHRLPVAQSITYADTLEAVRAALGLPPAFFHAD